MLYTRTHARAHTLKQTALSKFNDYWHILWHNNELEKAVTWFDSRKRPQPTLMYYLDICLYSLSYLGPIKYEKEVWSASLQHLMPQTAVQWCMNCHRHKWPCQKLTLLHSKCSDTVWGQRWQSVGSVVTECGLSGVRVWAQWCQSVSSVVTECGLSGDRVWARQWHSVGSVVTQCGLSSDTVWAQPIWNNFPQQFNALFW